MSHERRQSGLWSRNPDTGFFEQTSAAPKAHISRGFYEQPHITTAPYQYYHPQAGDGKRSFSDRTGMPSDGPNGVSKAESRRKERSNTVVAPPAQPLRIVNPDSEFKTTFPDPDAAPNHSTWRADPDDVPTNVRSKPWSPDPTSPKTENVAQSSKQRQASNASNVSELVRRGSVPDRSPLQNLETWSKEEKRARVAHAEEKARQRSIAGEQGTAGVERSKTVRSEKPRIVGDGPARRSSQHDKPRNVSETQAEAGARRFRDAKESLLKEDMSPISPQGQAAAPVANQSKAYDRAPEPHSQAAMTSAPRASHDVARSDSRKYRAKNAGFAGAEAAAWSGPSISSAGYSPGAAQRGKVAYDKRRSQVQDDAARSPISPISPDSERGEITVGRSNSKKLQKRTPAGHGDEHNTRNALQTDRMGGLVGSKKEQKAAEANLPPDLVPRAFVENPIEDGVRYLQPPQTANARHAKEQVGFSTSAKVTDHQDKQHHGIRGLFHREHEPHRGYQQASKPLDDWRNAKSAVLTAEDIEFEQATAGAGQEGGNAAWWEKNGKGSSSSGSKQAAEMAQLDGPYEEKANGFEPRLFLKCGPLLRYTGIRQQTIRNQRTNAVSQREVWKGTVMIVTEDDQSDLARSPTLRLFAQPMDLHTPPPQHLLDSGHELPPEYEDPVAGQVKLSRTGRALYVRPVHDIAGGVDLSREENNNGLYSAQRTPLLGPQATVDADGRPTQRISFQDKSRTKKRDGERAGRYRETKAVRLHSERGYTFWRFSIEIELASRQCRVAYRINKGPAIGFWVPARGESMNIMFHSCNGFSMSVDSDTFSGPDPLWRDVLNRHQARPFHVMLGGGDQIYNDAAMRDTELFREWLQTKNPQHKHEADFTTEMQEELEEFYLHRYAMWFSQGLFSMANSQIPMVNIWDDHDIIDGFGSYPHHFMSTRVFTGLGAIAFKYYMLFQHQSVAAETEKEEPSWLLGKSPGPYINERSRSLFMSLGRHVAFLGLDCRTERMRDEILSQETYDAIFDRCRAEIVKGETKHLIVLLGVPIAYPRLNFLENILTSRVMDPIKAVGRTGLLGGFVNKFDGGVEILDDLDDHWTAKHHKAERNWFIQELQELAAEKSVRITILGGDVHLGAVGQFFSNQKLGLRKDKDHRYIPNIISSAIVNTPPPTMMADVLNKRNKIHHLDADTDEDMIPMFSHDVDGSRRNNNHLLPRRNFCVIREYVPGSTPPQSPRLESTPATGRQQFDGVPDEKSSAKKKYPPGSMKRTMSLTRGPAALVRRMSGSSKKGPPPVSLPLEHTRPYNEEDRRPSGIQRSSSLSAAETGGSYFPTNARHDPNMAPERPSFQRRPTNLSEKQPRRFSFAGKNDPNGHDGAADNSYGDGHINLEGGLDISLCVEVDQHNPAGTTVPYRLLVPALRYEGSADVNTAKFEPHRKSLMERLLFNRKREALDGADDDASAGEGAQKQSADYSEYRGTTDGSRTPSPDFRTQKNTALNSNPNAAVTSPAAGMGLTTTGRGAYYTRQHSDGYGSAGQIVNHTPRLPSGSTRSGVDAYQKGYDLAGPPIGSQQQHHAPDSNGYPHSGYRRTSGPSSTAPPVTAAQGNRGPYGRSPPGAQRANGKYDGPHDEHGSTGSLTGSEDFEEEHMGRGPLPPQRRGSKAERFFGIGSGRQSMDQGRPGEGELGRSESKRKAGWKIWK
ncbi:putative phoD-like phosphatase, metallophosphatase domain, metallo-dependent phosphatase [Septoria linicola]|nr:putative phoD-like phosphatase, metallophosphatase domain, metallo-dependent phosphatase [Septoria linicola]